MLRPFRIFLMCIFLTATVAARADALDGSFISGRYVGGFVFNKADSTGVEGVNVIIEHDFDTLMSIETGADGWFESRIPISADIPSVHISFIKTGYQLAQKDINLTKGINTLTVNLEKIPNYSIVKSSPKRYFTNYYGYLSNSVSKEPLPGALITFMVWNNYGDIYHGLAVTRDSGYFTLSYPSQFTKKSRDYYLSYRISHHAFIPQKEKIVPEQQSHPREVNDLQENINWLFRLSICDTKKHTHCFNKSAINLISFVGAVLPSFDLPLIAFPIGRIDSGDKLVTTYDLEYSQIVHGKGSGKFIMDLGVGMASIKSRYKDREIAKGNGLYLVAGTRQEFSFISGGVPLRTFYRLEYSGYRLNGHWNSLFDLEIGF